MTRALLHNGNLETVLLGEGLHHAPGPERAIRHRDVVRPGIGHHLLHGLERRSLGGEQDALLRHIPANDGPIGKIDWFTLVGGRKRPLGQERHDRVSIRRHSTSGVDGEGAAATASVLDDDGSVEELLELGGEHARRNIGYAARTKAHNYGDATLWELLGMSVPHLSDDSRRGDRDKQPASTDHDPAPEGDFASSAFTTVGPATPRPTRSASVSKTSSGLTFAMFTSGPKAFTSNL